MKRTVLLIFIVMIGITLGSVHVYGEIAPAASMTGPAVIRAGNSLTVSVKMTGTGLSAIQGEIRYDPSRVAYVSSDGLLSGWTIELDSSVAGTISFLGIDDSLSSPISSARQIFTLTFKVKENVPAGTNISVSTKNLAASNGTRDFVPADSAFSINVSAPLSANAFLSGLSLDNADMAPSFQKNTLLYTASVGFSVSSLQITATPEDSKAKISISGNSLSAGESTDVLITVTAENGTKKVYTIRTARGADPNYKPSSNADLSEINVTGFLLSPSFSNEISAYVVWLPYEVSDIIVAAKAADAEASVQVEGGDDLEAGRDNPVTIRCTAEDGTIREYVVIARRASSDLHISSDSMLISGTTVSGSGTDSSMSGTLSVSSEGDPSKAGIPIRQGLVFALIIFAAGFLGGFWVCTKRKGAVK